MTSLDPHLVRRHILAQSQRAHVGHIGPALSIVELLCALYGPVLRIAAPSDPQRDRFILSKGHAALALYVVLHLRGWITARELDSFCGEGTALGVHPERRLPGVDFSTGSMGMGLGFAAGAALAARLQHSDRRAFALLSDGECNEGSLWEAVMFAGHHRLGNLIALVDYNQQQAFGRTQDVLRNDDLAARWESFGWDVHRVDGHDLAALEKTLSGLDTASGKKPHVIIADTVCGKGVSYMEGQVKWHYWPMSDDEYQRALRDVEGSTP
jgi:transketolase